MFALIKQSLIIVSAAFFCIMMGHLFLDITSDYVADNSSGSKDKTLASINN
jgi:hypothetical protein